MKIDKITAFVSTFGGLLVGALGSTYSTKVAGAILEGHRMINIPSTEFFECASDIR